MKIGDDKIRFSHDDLDTWLAHMEAELTRFLAALPSEISGKLNYSLESLDVLETWLLERFPDYEAAMADPPVLDGASRYVGETYRRLAGARWWMDPEGEILDSAYPQVTDFRTLSALVSAAPVTEVTAALFRRRGDRMSTVLRKQLTSLSGEQRERTPDLLLAMSKRHGVHTAEQVEFQMWLRLMDRALDELFAVMPENVRDKLDCSPASLDVLEAWLLDRYPHITAARKDTEVLTMDGVARYIGQTFLQAVGGSWWFDLDEWTHNGLPQIADIPDTSPLCPLALAREAVDRRSGKLLRSTLESSLPRRAPD